MRWLSIPLPVLLLACGTAPPTDVGSGPADDAEDPPVDGSDTDAVADDLPMDCDVAVAWLEPDDRAEHVDRDRPIEAGFTAPLPEDDRLWGLGVRGVAGTVEVADDRMTARFLPDQPLAADTRFTAGVTACDDTREAVFRTLGPAVDPEDVVGMTWIVPLDVVSWISPEVAGLFTPILPIGGVALWVEGIGSGAPRLVGLPVAFGPDGAEVDACDDVLDLGPVDLSDNPRIRVGPVDVDAEGEPALASVRVEGILSDDGARLEEVTVDTVLDTRVLDGLLPGLDICLAALALGEPCQPCPTDGAQACLATYLTLDEALSLPDGDDLVVTGDCD